MTEYSRPSKLDASDNCKDFNSGQVDLDSWLERFALQNQFSGMSTVFVTRTESRIAGFYALSTGGVEPAAAPERVTKGNAKHPVPVIILSRMATDLRDRGRGVGRALLGDALRRVDAAASEIGIRALLIHAKDAEAKAFYMHHAEFEPSPTDDLHLFLLMKDLRKAITR